GRRGLFAPQPPDKGLHRRDLVGSRQQQGQQQALLRPPQHQRAVVRLTPQRPLTPPPPTGQTPGTACRERSPPPSRRKEQTALQTGTATTLPPSHPRAATPASDAALSKTVATGGDLVSARCRRRVDAFIGRVS